MNKKILQALAWLVLIIGLIAAGCAFGQNIKFRPALTAQAPAWGVGCEEAHIGGYLSPVCREEGYHSIAEYTEGEGEPPEWYRPDEELAVVVPSLRNAPISISDCSRPRTRWKQPSGWASSLMLTQATSASGDGAMADSAP